MSERDKGIDPPPGMEGYDPNGTYLSFFGWPFFRTSS